MAEKPSTHKTEVFRIKEILPHENAEKMEIIHVFGGFTCCVGKGQFKVDQLAAYIQPDSIVPPTDDYKFLRHESDGDDFPVKRRRISVKKLRGVYSQGLIVPAPAGSKEGDDVSDILQIEHYEPEANGGGGGGNSVKGMTGEEEKAPEGFHPYYDIDNFNRYGSLFEAGEEIVATEKLHGCQARLCCIKGRMFAGSRKRWVRPTLQDLLFFEDTIWRRFKTRLFVKLGIIKVSKRKNESVWWRVLKENKGVAWFLRNNQNCTVYGEIYGPIQKGYTYGSPDKPKLAVFDILRGNEWVSWDESQKIAGEWVIPWVPLVYRGKLDEEKLRALAEEDSILNPTGGVKEGLVIKPVVERTHPHVGRVQLKLVSNRYYENPTKQ